ncbi:MAG: YraN family protein [Magnetospiraceae bacterium]
MRTKEKRQTAYRAGIWAETLAVWYLRLKGYRILARRLRSPVGELDIVARRGRVVAFIEVKSRPDAVTAAASLTPQQQRRIEKAALAYMAHLPKGADLDMRFDVFLVAGSARLQHMADAWRPAGQV